MCSTSCHCAVKLLSGASSQVRGRRKNVLFCNILFHHLKTGKENVTAKRRVLAAMPRLLLILTMLSFTATMLSSVLFPIPFPCLESISSCIDGHSKAAVTVRRGCYRLNRVFLSTNDRPFGTSEFGRCTGSELSATFKAKNRYIRKIRFIDSEPSNGGCGRKDNSR